MRFLLKEALKTLCGVNQWTYAVFWRIGCKQPKILVWEEHHYSPTSGLPQKSELKLETFFQDSDVSVQATPDLESHFLTGDKVHQLLNKMADDAHNLGEGLVGNVALTGEHSWISSENFHAEAHHPKVVSEVYQQFSAGLQTVAVVPVLPHGVVQFGSHFQVVENAGFVNDVAMLLHRLGHLPGALRSDELASTTRTQTFPRPESDSSRASSLPVAGLPNYGAQTSSPFSSGDTSNGSPSLKLWLMFSGDCTDTAEAGLVALKFMNPEAKDRATTATNSDVLVDQYALGRLRAANEDLTCIWKPKSTSFDVKSTCGSRPPENPASVSNSLLDCSSVMQRESKMRDSQADAMATDDICSYPRAGDDLFDVLGAEFRNQVLRSFWDAQGGNGGGDSPEMCPAGQEELESGISPETQADYLLEAVVSKPLSVLENSPNGTFQFPDYGEEESPGIHGNVASSGEKKSSASTKTISGKQDSGTSHYTFIYDSWIGRGLNLKRNNDASSGVGNKPCHKRHKPGENPRPRPRDRQMIQDRVKELREIVPNGAKCSIDSLLERTIKHMLFLQSVTKHAEKLKHAMEPKIYNDEGDLRRATYACEAAACPILVEDLSQPGHMLIEMLCQEQGCFLEIADTIRGLGLTILRGIIETRKNNDVWARFAVETNRDITRMEVSLTLVSFIERSTKRNSAADDD